MVVKKALAFMAAMFVASAVFAQQHITNFGVVDVGKVYEKYFQNSSAMKNYDKKRAEVQAELDKRAAEVRDLQTKFQDAQKLGLDSDAKRYQEELRTAAANLKNYKQAKEAELAKMKNSLEKNDEFYKKLNRTIKRVAENEGLSMILNVQNNDAILWYSDTVDITDKVITALSK